MVVDHVYTKQRKLNKRSTPYSKTIPEVVNSNGDMVRVKDHNNNQYIRNISYLKEDWNYTAKVVKPDNAVTPNVGPKRDI